MAEQLSPELIATLESRVEKIRADYNERLQKDREFIKGVVSKASFAAAVAVSVAAYFGISGFDDLVDRAIQKTNPREKWAAVLDDVRDHALVYELVTSRESRVTPHKTRVTPYKTRVTPYTTLELEAFNRLLRNPETRDQKFLDVVSLLKDADPATDVTSTLAVMRTLLAGKGGSEWIKDSPFKQELLISYLADRRFVAGSPTVLGYLKSGSREVQLAAIRYARECQVAAAVDGLSTLIKQHPADPIGSAAALALVGIAPGHDEAKKWLAALKELSEGSMDEAAKALRQLSALAQRGPEPGGKSSSYARSDPPSASASANGDALTDIIVDVVRSILLKGYYLTRGKYFGRPGELLYLAENENKWSNEVIQTQLLSPGVVDKLLRDELDKGAMDNFKHLVRGLSGISTGHDVNDLQQEVVFILEAGAIALTDGETYSKPPMDSKKARTAGRSWAIRQWRLKVDDFNQLVAESVARPELRGNVHAITLAKDSVFFLNTSTRAVEPLGPSTQPLARAEVASAPGSRRY